MNTASVLENLENFYTVIHQDVIFFIIILKSALIQMFVQNTEHFGSAEAFPSGAEL